MKLSIASLVFAAVIVSATGVWADVRVERTFETAGVMGMGASKGHTVTYIQGDKQRDESKTEFTGSVMKVFSGGPQTIVTVTRVDKGIYIDINDDKKSYAERPFVKLDTAKGDKSGKDDNDVKIVKNELKVVKTGNKKDINGFPCEEYVATWEIETENVKTKERSGSIMENTVWTTPATSDMLQADKETLAFGQAFMKKLGFGGGMSQKDAEKMGFGMMAGMMGTSEEEMQAGFATAGKELAKIKGYRIQDRILWKSTSKPHDGGGKQAGGGDEGESVPTDLGGLIGNLAGKAVTNSAKGDSGGEQAAFDMTTTVVAVKAGGVDSGLFEAPAGYKKR